MIEKVSPQHAKSRAKHNFEALKHGHRRVDIHTDGRWFRYGWSMANGYYREPTPDGGQILSARTGFVVEPNEPRR